MNALLHGPPLFWLIAYVTFFLATGVSKSFAATILDICDTCTFMTLGGAEASAIDGDILETRQDKTFDETYTPGGERTLRNQNGFPVRIEATGGPAIDLSSAGVGPVSIIAANVGDIVLDSTNAGTVEYISGGAALSFFASGITVENSKNNQDGFRLQTNQAWTFTLEKCYLGPGVGTNRKAIFINTGNSGQTLDIDACYFTGWAEGMRNTFNHGSGVVAGTILNTTFRDITGQAWRTDSRYTMTNVSMQDNGDDFLEGGSFDKNDVTFGMFEEESGAGWPASNQLTTSATFENVSSDIHGYRMASSSNGLNDGTTVGLSTDIEGISRPQGAAYDVGCSERPVMNGLPPNSLSLLGAGR